MAKTENKNKIKNQKSHMIRNRSIGYHELLMDCTYHVFVWNFFQLIHISLLSHVFYIFTWLFSSGASNPLTDWHLGSLRGVGRYIAEQKLRIDRLCWWLEYIVQYRDPLINCNSPLNQNGSILSSIEFRHRLFLVHWWNMSTIIIEWKFKVSSF